MASKPSAYVELVIHDQLAVSHISSVFTLASFLSFQVLFWRTAEEGQEVLPAPDSRSSIAQLYWFLRSQGKITFFCIQPSFQKQSESISSMQPYLTP